MNAYEIRHSLICEARNLLFEEWNVKMATERERADFESRAANFIPAPTLDDIKKAARELYNFVEMG